MDLIIGQGENAQQMVGHKHIIQERDQKRLMQAVIFRSASFWYSQSADILRTKVLALSVTYSLGLMRRGRLFGSIYKIGVPYPSK